MKYEYVRINRLGNVVVLIRSDEKIYAEDVEVFYQRFKVPIGIMDADIISYAVPASYSSLFEKLGSLSRYEWKEFTL